MGTRVEKTLTLNNGIVMPTFGLGVWQMEEGSETEEAVTHALKAGYRLIDTAKLYGNEASVGRAVRGSGIPREEIFVTTKLWPTDFLDPAGAFERSFKKLDLDYVDLYLIHWAAPYGMGKVWKAFEKLYEETRVRAIGISNFGVHDMEKLLAKANVIPAVNQIKFNPFAYEKDILGYSAAQGIAVEAYSPLSRGHHMNHPAIMRIASVHKKTPPQVMLRWALQHGTIVIPKSTHPARIEENMHVYDFELSEEEMAELDRLS